MQFILLNKTKEINYKIGDHMNNKITTKEYINAIYKILDKLEQRIATLEKVLASHAKCIGRLAHEKENKND